MSLMKSFGSVNGSLKSGKAKVGIASFMYFFLTSKHLIYKVRKSSNSFKLVLGARLFSGDAVRCFDITC